VLAAPTHEQKENHKTSAELQYDYRFWKLLQYRFTLEFDENQKLNMKFVDMTTHDDTQRIVEEISDRKGAIVVQAMLHTINLKCLNFHLRPFTLKSSLFNDKGIFILPVRSRKGVLGRVMKATPVFQCKLNEILRQHCHDMHVPVLLSASNAKELIKSMAFHPGVTFEEFNITLDRMFRSGKDNTSFLCIQVLDHIQFEAALEKPLTAFSFFSLQLLHFYGQVFITKKCQIHYQSNYSQSADNKEGTDSNTASADYARPPKIRVVSTPMIVPRSVVNFVPYSKIYKSYPAAKELHDEGFQLKLIQQAFSDNHQLQRCAHAATTQLSKLPKLLKVLNTALSVSTVQELQLWGVRFTNFLVGKALLGKMGYNLSLLQATNPDNISAETAGTWIKSVERGICNFFPLSLDHFYGESFCLSGSSDYDEDFFAIFKRL
jgi:hypothetical protein